MGRDRDEITFEITDEHLTLLRSMYVGWCGDEFGAPEIDPKRPYGNSDVVGDVVELLDWHLVDFDSNDDPAVAMSERATELHHETQTALQVVLRVGEFKSGSYVADKYRRNWRPA